MRDSLPVSLNSAHFKSSKVGAGQEVLTPATACAHLTGDVALKIS